MCCVVLSPRLHARVRDCLLPPGSEGLVTFETCTNSTDFGAYIMLECVDNNAFITGYSADDCTGNPTFNATQITNATTCDASMISSCSNDGELLQQ